MTGALSLPFDPTPRSCVCFLALAAVVVACGAWSSGGGLIIGVGVLLGGMGVLLVLRRYLWPRRLEIDETTIHVPTGFLRLRITSLSRSAIQRVWMTELMGLKVLCIRTAESQVEMPIIFFPDAASFNGVYSNLSQSRPGPRGR